MLRLFVGGDVITVETTGQWFCAYQQRVHGRQSFKSQSSSSEEEEEEVEEEYENDDSEQEGEAEESEHSDDEGEQKAINIDLSCMKSLYQFRSRPTLPYPVSYTHLTLPTMAVV